MRCDDARLALSLRADGEVPDVAAAEVDDHLGSCPECRRFAAGIQVLRAQLRFEAVDHVPDLGPAVVALLAADPTSPSGPTGPAATPASPPPTSSPPTGAAPPRPSRRRVAVVAAAAAAAGVVVGATFVGLDPDPPSLAAADVPERVVAGQDDVTALEGRYRISEPGTAGAPSTPSSPTAPPSRSRCGSRRRPPASRPPTGPTGPSSSTATAGGTRRTGPAPPLPAWCAAPPPPAVVAARDGPRALLGRISRPPRAGGPR